MNRITDILVVVNPLLRDQSAVAKAATLARWLGASIELLICNNRDSRHAPLLLTKPKVWAQPPVIMAAVDPGHPRDPAAALDQCILDVATSMAKRFETQAHAMHAYVPATIALTAAGGMPVVEIAAAGREAEQALRCTQIKRWTDVYGVPDENLHVDPGMAADYLPRTAAECHADIVVMGAVSRSDLKHELIGGTAERVLETMPCDVLVVKAPDFARTLPF